MVFAKKSILFLIAVGLLLPACANNPWATDLERSLAGDPSLEDGSVFGSSGATTEEENESESVPANFPAEIPRYANAEFLSATQPELADLASGTTGVTETRWATPDPAEEVEQFYRDAFSRDGWQLVEPDEELAESTPSSPDASPDASPAPASPTESSATPAATSGSPIVAERDGLRVTVAIVPEAASPSPGANSTENTTEFTIDYQFTDNQTTASSPSPAAPGEGAVVPNEQTRRGNNGGNATASPSGTLTAPEFTDLAQAPAELQPYIADLAKLGALRVQANGTTTEFAPNTTITRREYARWLVTANNLIYANQPARRIRLGVSSDQPAFQDVPTSDPDFGEIQGLANAGLIPSSLSGDTTTVTFRPDAPLTREELMLWKVPVDLRKALPNATIEAVQQTWGFQDAAQIDPRALRAILADFQNSDLSNIRRAFGYTTLFQPDKPVTRAEAAAVLWFFGSQGDGLSAKDVLQPGQQGG